LQLKNLKTYDEITKSFDTFLELRPTLSDTQSFAQQILNQQKDGYEIIAIIEGEEIVACIGFRMMTMLAWGKILYIDDLITKGKWQGRGYGKILLEHITKIAKGNQCNQIHLDTGYIRHNAHRFYLNQGFEFHCHHVALKLK
jgi:GNAT superfamily N-acetyltransferase